MSVSSIEAMAVRSLRVLHGWFICTPLIVDSAFWGVKNLVGPHRPAVDFSACINRIEDQPPGSRRPSAPRICHPHPLLFSVHPSSISFRMPHATSIFNTCILLFKSSVYSETCCFQVACSVCWCSIRRCQDVANYIEHMRFRF